MATALIVELGQTNRIVAVDTRSGHLPGLDQRPRIPDSDEAAYPSLVAAEADLVVLPADRISLAGLLEAAEIATLAVEVHDFDDGFALWVDLADRLGQAEAARAQIADASRPLAEIAAASYGRTRPRLAAIESFAPLTLVGDHRFATALIEIAGGENVTHGMAGASLALDLESLRRMAPVLLVHASPLPIDEAEQRRLARSVSAIAPLIFLEFDPMRFFGAEAVAAARTLRDAIAPHSGPLRPTDESPRQARSRDGASSPDPLVLSARDARRRIAP